MSTKRKTGSEEPTLKKKNKRDAVDNDATSVSLIARLFFVAKQIGLLAYLGLLVMCHPHSQVIYSARVLQGE